MSVDSIGNFLTVIRNGLMSSKRTVIVPFSNEKVGILHVLKDEGFIKDYQKIEEDNKAHLKIHLKYVNGESVIHELTRISKPGRRHYSSVNNIEPVIGGLGIAILSTSRGIISDKNAKRLMVGGEVICRVW